jgi:hypothetical protein
VPPRSFKLKRTSRAYRLTNAEAKKVAAIAQEKAKERYAVMVIKVKRSVRATRPGGTGLTEKREAEIDRALGDEKSAKAKAPLKKTTTKR